MMVNEKLLQEVLDSIEAEPHKLDSRYWVHRDDCWTTACIAGHTVMLEGYEPLFEVMPYRVEGGMGIADIATRLLGLSEEQAAELFDCDNTLDDLWSLAGKYSDGRVRRGQST